MTKQVNQSVAGGVEWVSIYIYIYMLHHAGGSMILYMDVCIAIWIGSK